MQNTKTHNGKCDYCGKEGQVWTSSDCHETGEICQQCVKTEGFKRCGYCGDMRAPENVERLDPAGFTQFREYCVGCIEPAVEQIIEG